MSTMTTETGTLTTATYGVAENPCTNVKCKRHTITVAEFKVLCGEEWPSGFDARLGIAAKKLCLTVHGELLIAQRQRTGRRNKTVAYPCGVLEEAYRTLKG